MGYDPWPWSQMNSTKDAGGGQNLGWIPVRESSTRSALMLRLQSSKYRGERGTGPAFESHMKNPGLVFSFLSFVLWIKRCKTIIPLGQLILAPNFGAFDC